MSLINMLQPWQWALLGLVPPAIVLLYFLKLKRTPQVVPSTYLWRKSIEDLHVNSIWQRLRASLLLLLQLLLVLLVMAALVRPGWSGSELTGSRFVLLVDNSASMQSRDVEPTRLDEAKRRAAEIIGQMKSGDVAMIVSFADTAQVVQAFTDNRRELLRRLEEIRPTNRTTSMDEALRVASGLAGMSDQQGGDALDSAQEATLFVLSDGRFGDLPKAKPAGLKLVYVPIGLPRPANLAITAFTTRPREDDKQRKQAFARLQNFGIREVETDLELHHDGVLLDSSRVKLAPAASEGVVFDLGELARGTLELRIGNGGVLAADDRAWAVVDPPAQGRVLVVTPGNAALELALATESAAEMAEIEWAAPDILASQQYRQRAAVGYYRLIVYDQCMPDEMPQANTLFFGRLPPGGSWQAAVQKVDAPQVIDVEATHPIMQLVDLGNVRFAEATLLEPPRGGTILVTTTAGPLMAIAPRGSYEDVVLGVELVGKDEHGEPFANTDWPLRLSFPVFTLNVLTYLGSSSQQGVVPSYLPGQSATLAAGGQSGEIRVRRPDGEVMLVRRLIGQTAQFSDTDELGVYAVEAAGEPTRHFVVNLFDSAESDVAPRDQIEIGYEEVSGQANWEGARVELWRPLLLAVLVVLCAEWYIYNRRVYV